jgi:hypothetical protein
VKGKHYRKQVVVTKKKCEKKETRKKRKEIINRGREDGE